MGDDGNEASYKQVELSLGDKIRGFFGTSNNKSREFIVINDNQGIREAVYE